MNAKFSLNLQLLRFKKFTEVTMSSYINNLRYLIKQLVEVKAMVEDEDAKAFCLNNPLYEFNNVIFTLVRCFPCPHTLEDTISSLLVKEKSNCSRFSARDNSKRNDR